MDERSNARLMLEAPELWVRLPRESSKSFHLFCLYRDMGPSRSLEKVHRIDTELTPILRNLKRFSIKYARVTRARAYDDMRAAEDLKENEQRIREFNKRRSEEALRMMDQAYDAMLDDGLETPEEKNKRYKLSFDAFRAIHKLDKEKGEVEQTGPFAVSVNFVPVRKQHDQREKKKEETDELR